MSKVILLLVFTIFSFGQLKPIKEENAKWVGLTAGLGVGALAGFVAKAVFEKEFDLELRKDASIVYLT